MGREKQLGFTKEQRQLGERYSIRFGLHSSRLSMRRKGNVRMIYLIGFDKDDVEYKIRFDKVIRMRMFNGIKQAVDKVHYFKVRAAKVHKDDYDYSLVTEEALRHRGKVSIICNRNMAHGTFTQTSGNHINHKKGCPKCGRSRLLNLQNF
jgi:hypothetical protein